MSQTRGISSLVEDILLDIAHLPALGQDDVGVTENNKSTFIPADQLNKFINCIEDKRSTISDLTNEKKLSEILKKNNFDRFSESQVQTILAYYKQLRILNEKFLYLSQLVATSVEEVGADELVSVLDSLFRESLPKLNLNHDILQQQNQNFNSRQPIALDELGYALTTVCLAVTSVLTPKSPEFEKNIPEKEKIKIKTILDAIEKLPPEKWSDFNYIENYVNLEIISKEYETKLVYKACKLFKKSNSVSYKEWRQNFSSDQEFLDDLIRSDDSEKKICLEIISKNSTKFRTTVEKYKALSELKKMLVLEVKNIDNSFSYKKREEVLKEFKSAFEAHKTIFTKSEDGPVKRFLKELWAVFRGKSILKTEGHQLVGNVSTLFSKSKDTTNASQERSASMDSRNPRAGQ